MEVTRVRFGSLVEWLLAAAFIAVVLAVGSIVLRDVRTVRPVMSVIAGEAFQPDAPAAVPARAVSVPMLWLADGTALRIGDSAEVAGRLGSAAQLGGDDVERTSAGRERITRTYNFAGTRFAVVLEHAVADGESRVSAIYVY